jgi:hypothetical protein
MADRCLRIGLGVLLVVLAGGCSDSAEPPVASDEASWEAMSVHEESASTHLWLVERALDVLAKHPDDARACSAIALLDDEGCKGRWRQGLFDADYRHEYNDGSSDLEPGSSLAAIVFSGASWKSHFYDPDTGENWQGERTPTGLTESMAHLRMARALLRGDKPTACYELGLALHFVTDLTHPMHAANFTNVDRPRRLHGNVEAWSMEVQDGYALDDWSGAPSGGIEAFVIGAARASKRQWAPMWEAIADAYEAAPDRFVCGSLRAPWWDVLTAQQFDQPSCWQTPAVKARVGESLRRAQDLTAQYLALIGGLD